MDPDQTALGPLCLSQRLLKYFSRREKQKFFFGDWRFKGKCSLYLSWVRSQIILLNGTNIEDKKKQSHCYDLWKLGMRRYIMSITFIDKL